MRSTRKAGALAVWAALAGGCGPAGAPTAAVRAPPSDPADEPTTTDPSASFPEDWPALDLRVTRAQTEDGVPVLALSPGSTQPASGLRWISSARRTIDGASTELSDGDWIFYAVQRDDSERGTNDVFVIGSRVYQDLLPMLTGRPPLFQRTGPSYCFDFSCKRRSESPEGSKAFADIERALGPSCGTWGRFGAAGPWLAGACPGHAARVRLGQPPEAIALAASVEADQVVVTRRGDALLVDDKSPGYVVWKVGSKSLGRRRTLAADEHLCRSSPAVLLRGLPPPMPEPTIGARLVGRTLGYQANFVDPVFPRAGAPPSDEAFAAQLARATAVLPKTARITVAAEAAVDLRCGAFVRAQLGQEGERIYDAEPILPGPIAPAAVVAPPACLPLKSVAVVPGEPELVLARTEGGELALAWLAPAEDRDTPAPPARGAGWARLGKVDSVVGWDQAQRRTSFSEGTWTRGGAAILNVGAARIVVSRGGASSVPPDARPMAVARDGPHLYAAIGPRLVVCASTCRIVDPGHDRPIEAVVPVSRTQVLLGYKYDRIGLYDVPSSGGEELADHPLAAAARAAMTSRP